MRALLTLLLSCLPATSQEGAQEASRDAAAAPAIEAPSFLFLQQPAKGLPMMPAPDGYTPTAPMFELGKRLFHDGILSHDRSVSCATCHPQATGFASAEPLPVGIRGQRARRHAPAIWNRGYGTLQRWDGGSVSLEAFVLEPIADEREMGSSVAAALTRLNDDADYRQAFAETFGGPADAERLQRALATFVRGIVRGNAPYDRFLLGEIRAMSKEARAGQWVFESKGACWRCHTPPLFTDEQFHNTGVGVVDGVAEAGRAGRTGDAQDTGKWKTPTLRGVLYTAPYMHDGSLATLEDVVDFYARGGNANAHLDPHMQVRELSADDRRHLVAFLRSL
ncbi:MAG: cytochrome-c peroxidase [Planctomycetes bacterium]|nr:cytochrome-c peroxidase [Planctomycetota bacterium]